jgi:hypothetical protein
MELRSQKKYRCVILLALTPLFAHAAEYTARHDHLRKGCIGRLTIDERGVSYREETTKKRKHPHEWSWAYQDIQQLDLASGRVRVLTYQDNRWKLGADRDFTFYARDGADFASSYALLKERLDQRFVAQLADSNVRPLWEIPVKHLGRIRGSDGVLAIGEDRLVYQTSGKREARTWRLRDIDNISTSGPFDLTLTTFERAKSNYGSRRDFHFQLKEPLDERKYNDLWTRIQFGRKP